MRSSRQAQWALGALALATLTISLDSTVLNVALPTLATKLHANTAQLQWFSAAYTLALAAALLPAGMLGDRFGRKALLVAGLCLFGIASAACAFAGSADSLIATRALLGLGAALIIPLSIAVLPVLFADPAEQKRAVTIWVAANAIGLPLGPIVGGWLLDTFWWGSVFLINVPLAAIGALAVAFLVPESRGDRTRRVDRPGVALSSSGLLGLIYGFIAAGRHGWTDPRALGCLVGGCLLIAAFVAWERRSAHPLIDLALLENPAFGGGALLSTLVNFALFGLLFTMPLYFQSVEGANALESGLRLLPMISGLLAGTRMADRAGRHVAPYVVIAVGFGLLATALAVGATTTVHTDYRVAAAWIALLGLGLGFAMPTTMAVALQALSAERAGAGAALLSALRQVGGATGVAILGAILSSAYESHLALNGVAGRVADAARTGVSGGVATALAAGDQRAAAGVRFAFVHGMDVMLAVCAAIAVAAVGMSRLVRSRDPGATPGRSEQTRAVELEDATAERVTIRA